VSKSRQSSKYLILAILTAFFLSSGFVLAAPIVGPRYFVKTDSPFWQRSFGVRHVFEGGFTSDLSGIQVRLAKIFGVEIEPVTQLHVLPQAIPASREPSPSEEAVLPVAKESGKLQREVLRARPVDQVPWGVKLVYNDPVLTSASGGAGVNVAVLDTGVLKTHPDLKNRVKQCKDFTQARVPVKDGSCDDKHGHGTHVSGIILADAGTDKLGIYGMAPAADLFSYKVCGNDGSCWADDIAAAMKLAADNGANLVNISLGADNDNSLIRNAIDYAVSKDVLVVAAGGNDGPYPISIDYPAANAKVAAVGAVDVLISVPDWSSRGDNPNTRPYVVEEKDMEFGAPGVNIESTWKNGGYAILSGTSMAAPHITGLAAKLWPQTASASLGFDVANSVRISLYKLSKDIWVFGDDDATGFGLPQLK